MTNEIPNLMCEHVNDSRIGEEWQLDSARDAFYLLHLCAVMLHSDFHRNNNELASREALTVLGWALGAIVTNTGTGKSVRTKATIECWRTPMLTQIYFEAALQQQQCSNMGKDSHLKLHCST